VSGRVLVDGCQVIGKLVLLVVRTQCVEIGHLDPGKRPALGCDGLVREWQIRWAEHGVGIVRHGVGEFRRLEPTDLNLIRKVLWNRCTELVGLLGGLREQQISPLDGVQVLLDLHDLGRGFHVGRLLPQARVQMVRTLERNRVHR
jgi:hypothetical protein